MNIVTLIEADGVTIRKAAMTNGGEFAGICPWCGGEDRFRVWPEEDGGRYWCRVCDKSGDSIQYLRERRGLSYIEACKVLGRDPGPRSSNSTPHPVAWTPKETSPPPAAWQQRAQTFLDMAVAALWSPRGDEIRSWLHTEKGLSDTTIKEAGLGFNLGDRYEPRASWGLEPSLKEDGQERKQWIPKGLVIPLTIRGAVYRIRIRRDDPGDGKRYIIVSGSSLAPMAWGQDKGAAVVVESELDAILIHQEAGDLVTVISMGSAQGKPDRITHEALMAAAVILVSLDTDDAGAKASWQFWPEQYGKKARRWPCINGKDPSEARLNGLDLRAWVIAGLFGTEAMFERFCIQTIDGGMTDGEAMRAMETT